MHESSSGLGRVWIFQGDGASIASAVFFSEEEGRAWVQRHMVSGVLSEYPVGDGCYDIALREGRFRPSKDHHGSPGHVAGFSPGLRHVHLRDGRPY